VAGQARAAGTGDSGQSPSSEDLILELMPNAETAL
jgi:hypothetical protein